MKGAEFTVYKMQGGQWVTYTKATWNDQYKEYMALNLKETDTENRSFKVVETKNPAGYTGTWEHEFTAEKEGVVTLTLDATNARKTGQITITKTFPVRYLKSKLQRILRQPEVQPWLLLIQ